MCKPIKIGIVGFGRAGNNMHRVELESKSDKFEIAAVCDIMEERAVSAARDHGCKAYTSIEELLADPDIELVDIATRSADHYAHAKAALLAGKHVFLEKPFCVNYAQAKELTELGGDPCGPRLFIRHNRRFEEGFEKAMEIIDSGKLGDVYEVKLTRNSYQRRQDWQTIAEYGGGQLLNWGPHIIDHSLRFCGGDYTQLYSSIKHVAAAGDCEDHIKIVFTGINGRIVDMEISGGVALPTPVYMIYGSKGTMISTDTGFRLKYLDPAITLSPVEAIPETPTGTNFGNPETLTWVEEDVTFGDGTSRIWDALYESIRTGKAYPIPLHQALKVVEVIETVKQNSKFKKI